MRNVFHHCFIFIVIMVLLLMVIQIPVSAESSNGEPLVTSPSAILLEAESGAILYEKDPDTARRPASVTKLMTMLLAFESLEKGNIHLEDTIAISENAAAMGGSQVYLEVGEEQPFNSLLKAMIVSSANDAATAVGEAIAGSEEQFVTMMNQRAKELNMKHSHFENACGLEAEGHMMSARDIGILSRELLCNHPKVMEYSTIWMDTIIHRTKKGESEFGLANTNKFLKKYPGANGLKTGYTSAAGYSMSATATRDNITLIAVVMGSKTKEERYADAARLLDYGFANCKLFQDFDVLDGKNTVSVKNGMKSFVGIKAAKRYQHVLVGTQKDAKITKAFMDKQMVAPIKEGQQVGWVEYRIGDKSIGRVNVYAAETVEKRQYLGVVYRLIRQYLNTK